MNNIETFKNSIRFIVTIFASREFAFIYCIIGTLAQTSHTYYLIHSISSLDGFGRVLQAIGLSIFISSSLLFFTAIADNDKTSPDYKRIHLGVNLFMIIEILINTYYYAAHLLINKTTENNVFDFIFAILVSCLIPVTIKLYAGIIKAKDWLLNFESDNQSTNINVETKKNTEELLKEFSENPIQQLHEENKKQIEENLKHIGKETHNEMFEPEKKKDFVKREPIFKGVENE